MARIVVIGAGMSGLAAAARLATVGHRVTVCEATGTYGGLVGRYEREGFAFDTGPTLLTLPAVYRDLALKTGREPLEQLVELTPVDPESRHVFADGTELVLPNASRGGVGKALDAAFGAGSGEAWGEVMNRGRAVWEATRRPLLEEPLPADPTPLHTDPYPVPAPRGLARLRRRRAHWTLADVAATELRGRPGLGELLYEYAMRFGLDPREAPAGATVLPYMEQSFGVWYVGGGIRALADAVYRRCEQRGVEFRLGTRVDEVLTGHGRVTGVLAGGERIEADAVLTAEPAEDAPAPAARAGRLSVFLALRGARPAGTPHRTVVHAADQGTEWDELFTDGALPGRPTVQVLRPGDPALAPDGHEAVTLTVTVPARVDAALLDSYTDRLLDHVAGAGCDVRQRLLWRETRTWGAVPAPALAGAGGAFLSAPNRSPVAGLYRIGAAAHPGGGLARVGMSAAVTAGLIGPA
ncbi:phytoene desaturase family protein [Kitasatospora sp. NPDC088346]|uniref:phytoene desaturase family protein n=1 Tax=Kitasatospora sp. NPDC088346 TaxID=3364073 RepID=UPI00380EA1E0